MVRSPIPDVIIPNVAVHELAFELFRVHDKKVAIVSDTYIQCFPSDILCPFWCLLRAKGIDAFPQYCSKHKDSVCFLTLQVDGASGRSFRFVDLLRMSRSVASALVRAGAQKGEVLGALCEIFLSRIGHLQGTTFLGRNVPRNTNTRKSISLVNE